MDREPAIDRDRAQNFFPQTSGESTPMTGSGMTATNSRNGTGKIDHENAPAPQPARIANP